MAKRDDLLIARGDYLDDCLHCSSPGVAKRDDLLIAGGDYLSDGLYCSSPVKLRVNMDLLINHPAL